MTDPTLSRALARIAPSRTNAMTDRAMALRAEGRDIISLSVGEPDFATPAHVVQAAKDALDAGDTKYTAVPGSARLRAAAALHFERDLGIVVPPAQVIVSAGGKQAIFHALLATLDPGDEVLIPSPWWVSYPEIVRFAGATVVDLPTRADGAFASAPRSSRPRSRPPRAGCCSTAPAIPPARPIRPRNCARWATCCAVTRACW
jgi:aspartate aminotransferase